VTGCCEHGTEPLFLIQMGGGDFLLLEETSASEEGLLSLEFFFKILFIYLLVTQFVIELERERERESPSASLSFSKLDETKSSFDTSLCPPYNFSLSIVGRQ
jgi:hypothetical protein